MQRVVLLERQALNAEVEQVRAKMDFQVGSVLEMDPKSNTNWPDPAALISSRSRHHFGVDPLSRSSVVDGRQAFLCSIR